MLRAPIILLLVCHVCFSGSGLLGPSAAASGDVIDHCDWPDLAFGLDTPFKVIAGRRFTAPDDWRFIGHLNRFIMKHGIRPG